MEYQSMCSLGRASLAMNRMCTLFNRKQPQIFEIRNKQIISQACRLSLDRRQLQALSVTMILRLLTECDYAAATQPPPRL